MKRVTKLTAFLLALVLVLGCSMNTFASGVEETSAEFSAETSADPSADPSAGAVTEATYETAAETATEVSIEAMLLPGETATELSTETEGATELSIETEVTTEPTTGLSAGSEAETLIGAETEDGQPAAAFSSTTEQSLYDRLMACETLEEMLDLLNAQEAGPSALMSGTEIEDFEAYLNEKLQNGEWTEDCAGERVASIIEILEHCSDGSGTGEPGTVAAKNIAAYAASNQNYVVYVYVCCVYNNERLISDECLELLGLDPDTVDQYGYIPVGQITNIDSLIIAKGGLDNISARESLLASGDDWSTLLNALGDLDTSTLTESDNSHVEGKDFTANKNNSVYRYIDQARRDTGEVGSSGKSQLSLQYKGDNTNDKLSCGFSNEEDYFAVFHLDLFFNTKKITFVTGNNGISVGKLTDGVTVDTRFYITGSRIQNPKDFSSSIPSGYYWDGKYYKDADFTEEWDGIGTPLNEDTTVYIKLIEYGKCRVEYKVAQGEGTVSVNGETFYVAGTGTPREPTGSTAAPETDYVFEGWYSDESCTTKVSSNATFVPAAPNGDWKENTTYTYYAKFVPASKTLTITKQVTGNMGDTGKLFAFTVTSDKAMTAISSTDTANSNDTIAEGGLSASVNLYDDETVTITVLTGATITITETNAEGYTTVYAVGEGQTAVTPTDGPYTISNIASDTAVTVTNNKDVTIDTGILLDAIPYILILAVVAAGVVYLMVRRRRNVEE